MAGNEKIVIGSDKLNNFTLKLAELRKHQIEQNHKHHDQEISSEIFIFLIIFLQILIYFGNKKYPIKFQEISFFFLSLYPLTLLYHIRELSTTSYFFILLWLCWGTRTLFLMYKALGPPSFKYFSINSSLNSTSNWKLEKNIPQKIYTWFLITHKVCYNIAGFSLLLFFVFPGPSFLILFICLYFGVLGRDCAEIVTTKISINIGYLNYTIAPENVCALCDIELSPTLALMQGTIKEDDIIPYVTLDCKHKFHKTCILGWTIVGKKDTCPYCKEKVYFEKILDEKVWTSTKLNVWWIYCLNFMRYLLVWNPIVSYFAIYFLKIFHFEAPVDSHGKPIY